MKRRAAVVVIAVLAWAATTGTVSAAAEPVAFTVSDASLRWAVNDETNNSAFAPGTWNLLSAGTIGNPGAGGQTLRAPTGGSTWSNGAKAGWTSRAGNTTIEDLRSDGSYGPTTFDGTRQDASGATTSPPGSGVLAQTRLVMRAGTGTVDPTAGTADLSWRGSFSVLYYSGMTYVVVSDPTLQVTPSSARLTATVSGFATSMDDASKWTRVPDARVTLADLDTVDLAGDKGFSANPRYLGVRYDAPASGTPQVRSGPQWGAFPSSLLTFLSKVGMASYWYSSGGATDAKKVAAPVAVSWDATSPVPNPVPTPPAPSAAQPSVSLAPAPPASSTVARPQPAASTPPTAAPVAGPVAPVAAPSGSTAVPPAPERRVVRTVYAADTAAGTVAAASSPRTPDRAWEWGLGTTLLILAALVVAAPYLHLHHHRRKAQP